MTVKELKDALTKFPEEMPIKVASGRAIAVLTNVTIGFDMDTNLASVWLCGERGDERL